MSELSAGQPAGCGGGGKGGGGVDSLWLLGLRGAVVAAVAVEGIFLLPVADQAPLLAAQVEVHRAVSLLSFPAVRWFCETKTKCGWLKEMKLKLQKLRILG